MLTIEMIRTHYALSSTFGHGWATSLYQAGPAVREAAFAAVIEQQSVEPLNRLHVEQVEKDKDEGIQNWTGVLATIAFAHTTRSGSVAWQVLPDGSARISVGKNTYAQTDEWSQTLTGREVVMEITAVPGVFQAIWIDGYPRLGNMLRMAAMAVQTGETQLGIQRIAQAQDRPMVHPSADTGIIRRSEPITGDEE